MAFYGMALVLAFSAIIFRSTTPGSGMLLVTIICILSLIRLAGSGFVGEISIPEPLLFFPLCGLLLLSIFQVIALPGFEIPLSVDRYATVKFICFLSGLIMAFDLLLATCRTRFRLGFLVAVVITIATFSAIFGLVYKWSPIFAAETSSALASTEPSYAQFANRNHFAFLMEMACGLLTSLLLYSGYSLRYILGLIAYAIIVLSLIDVQSRGGLLSWALMSAIAVFFFIITRTRSPENETRKVSRCLRSEGIRKVLLACGICAMVFVSIAVLIVSVGGDALVTRFEAIEQEVGTLKDRTRINRGEIWSSTVELIKQNPLAGVGFGAYAETIPRFDPSTGNFSLEEAHNDYLELAANGGLVAVALVLWFAVVVSRKAARNLRSSNKIKKVYCFGAMIGIVGVAFHSLVDFGLHIPVNIFILFALIVVATSQLRENCETTDTLISPDQIIQKAKCKAIRTLSITVAFAVIIITVGFFAVQTGLSDHYTGQALRNSSLDDVERAIKFSSMNCKAYLVRSEILNREKRPEAEDLERALQLCPQDHHIWLSLGEVRKGQGEFIAAETAFRHAVSLAPNYTQPNYKLGLMLYEQGRFDEAFQYFRKVAHGDKSLYSDIIQLASKTFSNDPQKIENAIGMDTTQAKKAIAEYFVENSLMTDSISTFLTENILNRDEKFAFIEKLIAARNFDLARKVWFSTLSEKAFVTDQVLFDGGFENLTEDNQGAFGWQVDDNQSHVIYETSETDVFSGRKALTVRFDGNVELYTSLLSQLVVVRPNTEYQLHFAYKSREVVSAGLPEIIISGAASNEMLGRSDELRKTGNDWIEIQVSFDTKNENAVHISLQRDRCNQNPCLIFGQYLFDNFSLDEKFQRDRNN